MKCPELLLIPPIAFTVITFYVLHGILANAYLTNYKENWFASIYVITKDNYNLNVFLHEVNFSFLDVHGRN